MILLWAGPALAVRPPAYIVIDVEAGTVLAHSQADRLWYPASITKIMTAYVTFQALKSGRIKLTSAVRISRNALSQPPSKMGYKVGTVINLDNAIKMMIVKSANDIAVAIAEAVSGSAAAFVAAMNDEAQRLGMTSTRFNNPNGLPDDGQVTTARDLAVLARATWNDFPEYREYFRISAIRVGKRVLRSYNTLLERYRGTNGMKTGFICASGFNIVASATRNRRTVIVVVLGERSSRDRAETAARLLDRGLRRGPLGVRPSLATFESAPVTGAPVNMREFGICGKRPQREGDDANPVVAGAAKSSALEPRFVLMDPVQVYTGRADPPSGVAPAGKVPLPRLRPRPPEKSAAGEPGTAPMVLQ